MGCRDTEEAPEGDSQTHGAAGALWALALLIAAMREHAQQLRTEGFSVVYHSLSDGETITSALSKSVAERSANRLITFPVCDQRLRRRLRTFCNDYDLAWLEAFAEAGHTDRRDIGFLVNPAADAVDVQAVHDF